MTTSNHYTQDRFLRQNVIDFFGGDGTVIKTVKISKYEYVSITDNCVGIFFNPIADVMITKFFLPVGRLKRYYGDEEVPAFLIKKSIQYGKMKCFNF